MQRSSFQGRPRGCFEKGVRLDAGKVCTVFQPSFPCGPKPPLRSCALLLDPLTSAPEPGLAASAPGSRPGPRLHSSAPRSPPDCSRRRLCWAVGSKGGLRAPPTWGPSQGPGQGLAPGRPGPRRCGRGGESRGIPGGEGSRAGGPEVGSGTGAFSLFRCLKLAPAERCGHVTERRQSASPLVSAFRARTSRRPRGAAAGKPPGW